MGHSSERTCIGCRAVFPKGAVVRIVAGPSGPVIDYREKLPGRAAYVCPRPACIEKALARETLSRALRVSMRAPDPDVFVSALRSAVKEKVRSLLLMANRAGKLAAGASAVDDALRKSRVEMLIFSEDIAEGTRNKLPPVGEAVPKQMTLFTKDEMGQMVGREMVGVVALLEKGFADAVWSEAEVLKGLPNTHR